MASLHPGEVIDRRYTLISPLGQGGMAEVWLARDEQVSIGNEYHEVALKVLSEAMVQSIATGTNVREAGMTDIAKQIISRFEREVTILRKYPHPNIARYLGSGQLENGLPYLAVEYLRGVTLEAEIDRRCKLYNLYRMLGDRQVRIDPRTVQGYVLDQPLMLLSEIFRIITDVLLGLKHLHAPEGVENDRKVTHRDIKPANIMFEWKEENENLRIPVNVKLLDLGIAKVTQEMSSTTMQVDELTRAGTFLGTPTYMATEALMSADKVTPASDVFSTGVTMFEMLTGLQPYVDCSSPGEVLAELLQSEPFDPSKYVPGVPPKLREVVMIAMARKREDRYRNAHEMLQAVQKASYDAMDYRGVYPSTPPKPRTFSTRTTITSRRPLPGNVPSVVVAPQTRVSAAGRKKHHSNVAFVAFLMTIVGLTLGGLGFIYMKKHRSSPEVQAPAETAAAPSDVPRVEVEDATEGDSDADESPESWAPPAPGRVVHPRPAPEPEPKMLESDSTAQTLFDTGIALLNARRYHLALERFKRAKARAPDDPKIDQKIAECERKMRR